MCPMCGTYIEHLRHLFFECSFAKECWQRLGLMDDIQEVEEALSWVLETLSKGNTYVPQKMTIILSGIWFSRNKKVWEGKEISATVSIELSTKQVQDWLDANKGKLTDKTEQNSPRREEQVRRRPPETGFLKLNVDAAMCTITHMYTLGMIIRNDTGQFLMGKI